MEMPWQCTCGSTAVIDLQNLERRPLSQVAYVEGFYCDHCNEWKPVFYCTDSLRESLTRLEKASLKQKRKLYPRVLRKARNVQEKYGKVIYKNMVVIG